MHRSTDRIVTTHVGSLPRSKAVADVLFARERDDAADPEMGAPVIAAAVAEVVRRQVAVGIDVVSDGEMSKTGFSTPATSCSISRAFCQTNTTYIP